MKKKFNAKRMFAIFTVLVVVLSVLCSGFVMAFADTPDPNKNEVTDALNNIKDLIFAIIKIVGLIAIGWGIAQLAMSFQSHDTSQRTQGIWTLTGGALMALASVIVGLIVK